MPAPFPDIHINPPDIPHIPMLAEGGRIAQTGIAVVHKGETVLPAGAGTVNNFYFPQYVGSKTELMDWIRNQAQVFEQRNGRTAFG